jgi:hypothetical protein
MRCACYDVRMSENVFLEWEGREYDHEPKSADWYWALSIVALALVVVAVLFHQYLLAVLVIVGCGTLAVHAAKAPPVHRFRLVDRGLIISNDLHPYERMRSFSVLEDPGDKLPALLSIKTDSWLAPHLVIPLNDVDAEAVYLHFLERVEEGEHKSTMSDVVASWLGF